MKVGGFLWRPVEHYYNGSSFSLSLTPRIRFDWDGYYTIGLQWLASWLYVCEEGVRRPHLRGRNHVELLPHVWIYSNLWQVGVHLDWIFWRWHLRLWKRSR